MHHVLPAPGPCVEGEPGQDPNQGSPADNNKGFSSVRHGLSHSKPNPPKRTTAPKWSLDSSVTGSSMTRMFARTLQDETTARLLSWLRQREDEMAALLADLIAVPTENPPGRHYREFTELVRKRADELGIQFERLDTAASTGDADEAPPCLSASYGQGQRTFYFHGHYDVVPAQSEEQFQAQRKEHFVFGRGACDMKGGIVSMLYAMLVLKECDVQVDGKVSVVLIPDEETGGARGSARLLEQGILGTNGAGMLLAEPTSGVVWNANRGAISLRVRVFGKSAHVGLQHQGENAFERMHQVVERLQTLKQEVERRTTKCNIGAGQAPNSILMLG